MAHRPRRALAAAFVSVAVLAACGSGGDATPPVKNMGDSSPMSMRARVSGTVEPDYFQFYAARSGAGPNPSDADREDFAAGLFTDGEAVAIFTVRKFGTTAVDVEVWDTEPRQPPPRWQHVVEVSLRGGPRELDIFDWSIGEPAMKVEIPTGPVRLRVSWTGLTPGLYEGMDDEGESDEHLLLQIWPQSEHPRTVVRAWAGWPR